MVRLLNLYFLLCSINFSSFFFIASFFFYIMGAQVVDYRVSAIVVLCKDCGNDVGLYPARHKCTPVDRPPMPPLPLKFSESSLSSAGSASASSETSLSVNKWGSRREKTADPVEHMENTEESIYFNNFAQNLPDANEQPSTSGRKLWGKVRQNDKWKQLNEKSRVTLDKERGFFVC